MSYRTIDPEEAELMWTILRLEKELTSEKRLPTAEEIGLAMDHTPADKVHTLISALNSGEHEYVCSDVRLKKRTNPGEPKRRGAPLATYHLAEMFMVQYPRTGFFLTTAAGFKKNENRSVVDKEFVDYLFEEFGLTRKVLQEDFSWCVRTHYINRFPLKKPTYFQLTSRTYHEMAWLEILAANYMPPKKN